MNGWGTFPKAGETFWRGSTQSRKPSGVNVFSGYISEDWRGFSLRIDQKPEMVWSCSFSSYRSGLLGEPRGRWEKAAGGCLTGTSFRGTFPDAGETFCRELTKSRRQSGAALFQAIAAGRLGSLAVGGKRQPEVVWPERLFGVHFRTLARLFAEN